MLSEKLSSYSFPTKSIPIDLVDCSISNEEYDLIKILGKGLECQLAFDDSTYKVAVKWNKSINPISEDDCVSLATDFGVMNFYNYQYFFQSLSGVDVSNNTVLKNIFPIALAMMPKPIVNMFGCLALVDGANNNSDEKFCLPISVSAEDCSCVVYVDAAIDVWMPFLEQSFWEYRKSIPIGRSTIFPKKPPCPVGVTSILFKDYLSLEVGDLLMVEKPLFDIEGNGIVKIGCRSASVVVKDESIKNKEIIFLGWCDEGE